MLSSNITVGSNGHLYFGGQDTVALAQEFGTPLYVMDEVRVRENMQMYRKAFAEHFGPGSQPLYASKANSFKRIYEIAKEEGMGIDVVSSGEIYTALKAGFPLSQAWFHSNNKTDWDIAFAMDNGIGHFVVDNREELDAINAIAGEKGLKQPILLRLTPGIDPHTYEAVATGKVDSKFGTAIETGQALEMVRYTLGLANIELRGFHCHVGSQVFGEDIYERASDIMLEFMAQCRGEFGVTLPVLDMGGGYGVRYVDTDGYVDIPAAIGRVAAHMKAKCAELGMELPEIHMEPGRSIVADAGMTLYEVGTIKKITDDQWLLEDAMQIAVEKLIGKVELLRTLDRTRLINYIITTCKNTAYTEGARAAKQRLVFNFAFCCAISAFISSIITASFSSHSSFVLAYTFREIRFPSAPLGEYFPSQRWSLI